MKLFCKTCEKFVEADGLQQVTDWKRGKALFLDRRGGTSHELLDEVLSKKKKILPPESATSISISKQVGSTPPITQSNTGSIAGVATISADEAGCITDDAVVNPANSGIVDDASGESASQVESYDDWSPAADEYFAGRISKVNPNYIFAILSNGEQVFIPLKTVKNFPNNHRCMVSEGDTVSVSLTANNQSSVARWLATETWLQTEYALEPEEPGTVVSWKDHAGHVERVCGCWIFTFDRESQMEFLRGENVVISGWEENTHERGGVVATSIKRWRNPSSGYDDSTVIRC